jgi:hypothetical protein
MQPRNTLPYTSKRRYIRPRSHAAICTVTTDYSVDNGRFLTDVDSETQPYLPQGWPLSHSAKLQCQLENTEDSASDYSLEFKLQHDLVEEMQETWQAKIH